MTYYDIISALGKAGIENPETDASLLISELCGVPLHELVYRKREDFRNEALISGLERRIRREPLQYILGAWYFHGLRFELNRDCLCPREDTELIVDTAIKLIPENGIFCDIGTGSGAIAVSVLVCRPDLRALCADISESALSAARKNAENNAVLDRCSFVRADALNLQSLKSLGTFDAVLSNPPYIPTKDCDSLAPELSYEPRIALDGGSDGMTFYRSILNAEFLCPGAPLFIFEIAYDEKEKIETLAGEHGMTVQLLCDLAGNNRCAVIRKNTEA